MLSADELRRAIDRPDLSDEQAAQVRDFLYWLAGALVEDYLREQSTSSPKSR